MAFFKKIDFGILNNTATALYMDFRIFYFMYENLNEPNFNL